MYHERKIKDKKRVGFRGPKKRQSVFRNQLNLYWEEVFQKLVEQICLDNKLSLRDHYIKDERIPWEHTWESLKHKSYRLKSKSIKDIQLSVSDDEFAPETKQYQKFLAYVNKNNVLGKNC